MSLKNALMGALDKRFTVGIKAPLFVAITAHKSIAWLEEGGVDITAPWLRVVYLQVIEAVRGLRV